ncbi:MAG TPA: hypothetical protein VG711_02495 [Phycisphaerales bacterium]|nr:hypothetical protein [Phycisphaerales bacterium]
MKGPLDYQQAVSIPPLAPTIAALGDDVRESLSRLSSAGFRHAQLSSLQAGTRPKDLDQSGRRDLAATLKRLELTAAGVDCWVPTEHFVDPERVDRAVAAVCGAIELASDLGRVAVSLCFPARKSEGGSNSASNGVDNDAGLSSVVSAIGNYAAKYGVKIADFGLPVHNWEMSGVIGVGIDVAAAIANGDDPVKVVHGHAAHLVSVRVSDMHRNGMRGPIGDQSAGRLGVLELRVAVMMAIGVQPVVLDARQWPDAWGGIMQSKVAWEKS